MLSTSTGLDIGYVPAGVDAFFGSSGLFGPQLILYWPAGPVVFRSVENACTRFSVDPADRVPGGKCGRAMV